MSTRPLTSTMEDQAPDHHPGDSFRGEQERNGRGVEKQNPAAVISEEAQSLPACLVPGHTLFWNSKNVAGRNRGVLAALLCRKAWSVFGGLVSPHSQTIGPLLLYTSNFTRRKMTDVMKSIFLLRGNYKVRLSWIELFTKVCFMRKQLYQKRYDVYIITNQNKLSLFPPCFTGSRDHKSLGKETCLPLRNGFKLIFCLLCSPLDL